MRKFLVCLFAALALLTTGCKKDVDSKTHYVLVNEVKPLEGHEYYKLAMGVLEDEDKLNNDFERICQDESIKNKEEAILGKMREFAEKYSNGLLYGKLNLQEVNESGAVQKTQSVEITLKQNTYKYVSNFVGANCNSFAKCLDTVVERLDRKVNLTDENVISSIDSLMLSYSDLYIVGTLVVSKSNDFGKTFSDVKTWTRESKTQYLLEYETFLFPTALKKIVRIFNDDVDKVSTKDFASSEEAKKFAEDSIFAVYNNRFIYGAIRLLTSTDGFSNSEEVYTAQFNQRQRMRFYKIVHGSGNDYAALKEALLNEMVDIEKNGICYEDDADQFVDKVKDVCRNFQDVSGTLNICILKKIGPDQDVDVEMEFELPIL